MKTWDGIYNSYDEAVAVGQGHDSTYWVDSVYKDAKIRLLICRLCKLRMMQRIVLKYLKKYKKTTYGLLKNGVLTQYITKCFRKDGRKIEILDVGGAMGLHYLNLCINKVDDQVDRYYIFESNEICNRGNSLFKNDKRIEFIHGFPKEVKPFPVDLIYSNVAINYIKDYDNALVLLSQFNARYIIFERFPLVRAVTFYSRQYNVGNNVLATQFINEEEFIDIICRSGGYSLIDKIVSDFPWDIDNFPQQYRPYGLGTLVFEKINESKM